MLRRFRTAAPAILLATAPLALADSVTGHWDFENAADGFNATVGADAEIWFRPTSDQDLPAETQFGSSASFGLPALAGGASGVMKFAAADSANGYAMLPGIAANGGGLYVNQYTLIMDVLYPLEADAQWRSLWQTSNCNSNDGDLFVDSANGIGISGEYAGAIAANTWYRLVFSFDLTTSTLNKYVDGVLVGTQALSSGLDGRWSLSDSVEGLPSFVFSDESGETTTGYVSSIQIRDYAMDATEVGALGGASAGNIPGGAGVAGQWDFENPADGLHATVGNDLQYWNAVTAGCATTDCPQDLLASTQFVSSAALGIPNLPDGPANGMRFDAAIPCTGYQFPHGANANGGGVKVNQYSLITDVYFSVDDYFTPPAGHSADWISIYQSWPLNDGDAMLFIRTADAALGDDGSYDGTEFSALEATWLRIVVTVDTVADAMTKYVIFADDSVVGPVVQPASGFDGKRALSTNEAIGRDHLLMFADEDYETHRGFVSSIQVRDYAMDSAEVAALGGPRAAGIPLPPNDCPEDLNGDGVVDLTDLSTLLAHFGAAGGPADGDLNGDGQVDLTDLSQLLIAFGASC